jgi:F420-dependent oxidoreductase-like protein
MRLGLFLFPTTLDDFVADVRQAADEGFPSVWSPNIFGFDAITLLSLAGREVPGIELGTAVVPTYPRHPMALAQQALTAAVACRGQFVLGIGLSHKVVIEGMYGLSFDKPALHMREYLDILVPLLRTGKVNVSGQTLTGRGQLSVPGAEGPPLLLAALAPQMLRLAGAVADGTVTWMTGPRTVEEHINPAMQAAATAVGRPKPRSVVGIPACVTTDVDAARARSAKEYVMYGHLPSYRAMLDREGLAGPEDFAVIGDEATLRAAVDRLFAAGADDVVVQPFGSKEEIAETRAALAALL